MTLLEDAAWLEQLGVDRADLSLTRHLWRDAGGVLHVNASCLPEKERREERKVVEAPALLAGSETCTPCFRGFAREVTGAFHPLASAGSLRQAAQELQGARESAVGRRLLCVDRALRLLGALRRTPALQAAVETYTREAEELREEALETLRGGTLEVRAGDVLVLVEGGAGAVTHAANAPSGDWALRSSGALEAAETLSGLLHGRTVRVNGEHGALLATPEEAERVLASAELLNLRASSGAVQGAGRAVVETAAALWDPESSIGSAEAALQTARAILQEGP